MLPVEVCCGMQFVMQYGEIRKLDTNKCYRDIEVGANFPVDVVNSNVNLDFQKKLSVTQTKSVMSDFVIRIFGRTDYLVLLILKIKLL